MLRIADAAWTDVRQAVRRIRHSPWLSLVVVMTLALSIAANTTIFSLLKATVLQTLPTAEPDRLVAISGTDSRTNAYSPLFLPMLRHLQEGQQTFAILGAFVTSVVRVEQGDTQFDAGVEGVTAEYFDVLGVRAKSGRLLSQADSPMAPVGILSDRLARRMFGDANPVGSSIVAEGRRVEIIGVLQPDFIGIRMDGGDDVFLPLPYMRSIISGDAKSVPRVQMIIGRLQPGATLEGARSEVLGRWPSLQLAVAAELPAPQRAPIETQQISVDSFARGFSTTRLFYGRSLTMVMGLAAALLAVGCVNLNGLMLARAFTRQHEFAVRRAMGVGRARLFQQAVIDGVVLSIVALVIAVPLAWWSSTFVTAMVSLAKPLPIGKTTPDGAVIAMAAIASLSAGLLIGLLPARRAMGLDMDDVLRGRGTAQRIRGTSRVVLIAQVALSMVLVVGAGLFVATLAHLYSNMLQQREHPIIWTRLARHPLQRATLLQPPYFQSLQERAAAVPGVDAAAMSMSYPAYLNYFDRVLTDTVSLDGAQASAIGDFVTPGFFEVYSIAVLRGRDFTWFDNDGSRKVAIVNETLARKLSADGDVIGRIITVASGPVTADLEVVGVVADANISHIRERQVAGIYRPMMQEIRRSQIPMLHLRVPGDRVAAERGYIEAVNAGGQHFVRSLFTMEGWIRNAVVEQRLIAGMASAAGMLAMVLACVGLFGVLAYSVSSRVREIGIRISVGATAREVMRMIVREGLLVAVPGVLIGIPLALAVAWTVRSQLYGVSATDPWTIAGAALVFTATAAFASWLPARRASRIAPVDALRQD